MLAKVIDKNTKQCEVGLGSNISYYKSKGMTEMEVEKAYDGKWYLKGYAPEKPQSIKEREIKAVRDSMINDMTWRVERVNEQRELGLPSVDDYGMLLEYRQYLRDYPDKTRGWWKKEPLSYEDWCKKNEEE